jgi:cytochrome bd-type quinol oxidase subunit 2
MNTMKQIIVTSLASLLVIFGLSFALAPATAGAQSVGKKQACEATGGTWNGGACSKKATNDAIDRTVDNIVNLFSVIVGIVAVIMIIIGGFKYVTSNGDSGQITSAKNTVMYAIVGLIVVAIAQILVRFVLAQTNV